jgi:hypothetical protein
MNIRQHGINLRLKRQTGISYKENIARAVPEQVQ